MARYNHPPNWPTPPKGWTPPPGWKPNPAWGESPAGWQFWTDDSPQTAAQQPAEAATQERETKTRNGLPGWIVPTAVGGVMLIVGVAIGLAGKNSAPTKAAAGSTTKQSPGPTVTVTALASAAPTVTATVTATATETATATTAAKTTPAPAPAAPAAGEPSDKGWTLVGLTTKNDGLGDFGGTARITNTNDGPRTGVFTITLLQGTTIIASLEGSADGASPGQTVTVDLISEDAYATGKFTAEFQTDTSY